MSDESQWVVAPDEARVEIAVGKDAKLSPAVRDALEQLVRTMEHGNDVSGYMSCQKFEFSPSCSYYISCKGVSD